MRNLACAVLAVTAACSGATTGGTLTTTQDSSDVAFTVTGLAGPEAVRFDPAQDVWFVANFGPGQGDARDSDGFITRLRADGAIEALRFMTGTAAAPLHQPRGMYILGDTLWVADADGVHGFDRRDGRHLAFIDFRMHEPGFLNDVAAGTDGMLYVTDSGRARVYRVRAAGGRPEIVADSLPASPNGITWDAGRGVFLLAPWQGDRQVRSLARDGTIAVVATAPAGRVDGIEVVPSGILIATQEDSSLWIVGAGAAPQQVVRTRGRPADIGYDARRALVAVPYIALNRVDVWQVRPRQ